MSDIKTIDDDIMPRATPTEDEIRRWQALPRVERQRRFEKAIQDGFDSGVSTRSIDEIINDAHARVTAPKNG